MTFRTPYPQSRSDTQHFSDQGSYFSDKEVWQWACACGTHWPYQVPNAMKQFIWQNNRMTFGMLSHSASYVAIPRRAGTPFSRRLCTLWLSLQYIVPFLWQPEFTGPGIRGGNGSDTTRHYPQGRTGNISVCFHDLLLCWPRRLSSRGNNASIRRQNNDSIDLVTFGSSCHWSAGTQVCCDVWAEVINSD